MSNIYYILDPDTLTIVDSTDIGPGDLIGRINQSTGEEHTEDTRLLTQTQPTGLLKPVYNTTTNTWEETATATELEINVKNKASAVASVAMTAGMAAIVSGYPEAEQKTWSEQLRQAKSVIANDGSPTLLLDAIALAKGVDTQTLATTVIAKSEALSTASGLIMAKYIEDKKV